MAGIITPGAYALTLAAAGNGRLPVILWQNRVLSYEADEEAAGYPVSNLENSSTVEGWRGTSTAPQAITMVLDGSQPVEAVGFVRHNLGTILASMVLAGLPAGADPDEPSDWVEIIAETVLADDGTVMMRFAPGYYDQLLLAMVPDLAIPRIAVLWAGPLLTMERGVQPHTPIGWGRRDSAQTGKSLAGDFLGRVITQSTRQATATFNSLTPGWLRTSDWLAFAAHAASEPWFFAWDPQGHPAEVGFCWSLNDLVAEVNHLVGYGNINIEMEGVVD